MFKHSPFDIYDLANISINFTQQHRMRITNKFQLFETFATGNKQTNVQSAGKRTRTKTVKTPVSGNK